MITLPFVNELVCKDGFAVFPSNIIVYCLISLLSYVWCMELNYKTEFALRLFRK